MMRNFITTILLFIITAMPALSFAESDYESAKDKADNIGNTFLNKYGSKEGMRTLSNPLVSGNTQMTTIGGRTSFNGQLLCPSSKNFMKIQATVSSFNDLSSVVVSQDLDMDGSGDSTYSVPFRVSGVCGNGIFSCDPGT